MGRGEPRDEPPPPGLEKDDVAQDDDEEQRRAEARDVEACWPNYRDSQGTTSRDNGNQGQDACQQFCTKYQAATNKVIGQAQTVDDESTQHRNNTHVMKWEKTLPQLLGTGPFYGVRYEHQRPRQSQDKGHSSQTTRDDMDTGARGKDSEIVRGFI